MKKVLILLQIYLMIACQTKTIEKAPCSFDNNKTVSFNQELMPLIKAKCLQCHDSKNHYDGIILETYNQVKENAQSGELYDSVVSINGAAPRMPKGGQLTDCEVNIIKFWIQQGSLNN
ncbi:hypothetical protein Emtol_0162 (plasmid) [Emticicia oligotrophica DSM 17448]|uniref:Cytochrome c domain-containing protein n=1 Tax=Emticicia oligotrophica (strain DSM 17448 / CIP 109782 / MTCC 6937 / GPTSA100-15) TaxID=929562 RepID=A0ABM5N7Z9_EMTOG|nr:hypothetical protein [Emticicia oligotrophica]AFK05677.1 hypothetical protein Emtol_0162 [Emticicia oligotrophica DSM 17448]